MSATGPADASRPRLNLPDFCAARAVLAVALICELTAVVLTLARAGPTAQLWTDLARTSLFLLWIGLGCAALLCALRRHLGRLSLPLASGIALGAMVAAIAVVSEVSLWMAHGTWFGAPHSNLATATAAWRFRIGNLVIGAVVAALALRYFHVSGEWRRNVELQARARVHALQARIRPHFLFNSMNTIAALTRSNPAQAEEAVQDLADLFRATLSDQRQHITLAEELEVARTYERIEKLRMGERLKVVWQVTDLPPTAQVPGLLLQPLLENAIHHGIEPRPNGGVVTVSGVLDVDIIGITVRNPLPESNEPAREGHRLALANIRERMELMYAGRARVESGRQGDEYVVRLRFPHIDAATPAVATPPPA
ncbi:MAG: histidine kinase [Gammaproteobacteria bacterium]|nr:histidine kinase [Gammaproteobacteria bacterium]